MTNKLLNNRYQVIQVLGVGGFGETFLAEDTYMPSRRRCVIKQLKPIANDPQTYQIVQQRFEREAATLEYLGEASDQIPKLYAYFSENGQFYLVQEWIQGSTLGEIVAAKGMQRETTVREILISLLSVLDYIHSKGIIHRDIKPDNIILRSHDSKPILIDFGAIKETMRSVVNLPGHRTQSLVIGTPGFMPTEQALGRPVYATDLYSLALTAICLLTGKHPQELRTNLQTGEILWQDDVPNISPNLAMVLNQAIKPNAGDRYSTASKMLYDLQSVSTPSSTKATVALSPAKSSQYTQPLSSPQKTPIISASTPVNWRKPAWIVGSLVVGSLIGATAIARISRQPVPEEPIATLPTPTPSSKYDTTNSVPSTQTQTPIKPATLPTVSRLKHRRRATPVSSPFPIASTSQEPEPQESEPQEPEIQEPESQQEPVILNTPRVIEPSVPALEQKNQKPASPTPSTLSTPFTPSIAPTPFTSPTPHNIEKPRKDTSRQNVPAFPTGTSRNTVEAALGKPARDLRGAWRNTRAVTYQLVPNQIDLGYLFDRNSGTLRQTEVAFAQSVNPQVMQTTVQEMLGGETTEEIQEGLQQVQQRHSDNFSFTKGSLKGQIVRQECDLIYISIWDSDLHDFVSPSQDRKC
ncbi:MAG: protein kinase [Rhizonema sp. PD37]|nr:protein kinase [Rhizonema sp. PD37]